MEAQTVLSIYNSLESVGVRIWLDGGWGVDALLEGQTRDHKDLDIVIEERDVKQLRELFSHFREIKLEIARPHNFVLADEAGNEIDVHVIEIDEHGDGVYGPKANGEMYPAASLAGIGKINDQSVRCVSAEWSLKFHSGYELKVKDYRDMAALCGKFNLELPDEYKQFKGRSQYHNAVACGLAFVQVKNMRNIVASHTLPRCGTDYVGLICLRLHCAGLLAESQN